MANLSRRVLVFHRPCSSMQQPVGRLKGPCDTRPNPKRYLETVEWLHRHFDYLACVPGCSTEVIQPLVLSRVFPFVDAAFDRNREHSVSEVSHSPKFPRVRRQIRNGARTGKEVT